jgi:uncharacterized membrane protein YdbT with pleckstrin-like domain
MPEQNLWSGTSSQWKNLGPFLLCLLVIPLPWAIYRWLVVKTTTYTLTTERLLTSRGIFSKVTDSLELYRVHDFEVAQPFFQRILGLKTIALVTGDTTTPRILIDYIPAALNLQDKVRQQVEECRMRKRVRTVDVEDGDNIHPGEAGALS